MAVIVLTRTNKVAVPQLNLSNIARVAAPIMRTRGKECSRGLSRPPCIATTSTLTTQDRYTKLTSKAKQNLQLVNRLLTNPPPPRRNSRAGFRSRPSGGRQGGGSIVAYSQGRGANNPMGVPLNRPMPRMPRHNKPKHQSQKAAFKTTKKTESKARGGMKENRPRPAVHINAADYDSL